MPDTASKIDDVFLLAQSLPTAEKLQLISQLWDAVRLSGNFRPTATDLSEIQRRSAELDAGTVTAIPWEVALESLQARLAGHE